jgi:hypothetical protein
MSGSLQPKPGAARRRENVSSDVQRRSETRFTMENGLSTLVKRIMRAPSKERMRKTVTSLAVRMEGLEGIRHIERSPHMGNLGVKERRVKGLMERDVKKKGLTERDVKKKGLTERDVKKKGLTDQGDTEKNPIMRGLGAATRKRR